MQHGAAVLVGPHRQNFADAYGALIANGGAIVVQSAEDIANVARKLLLDEAELASVRTRGSAALATISGALPRTIEALLRYLPSEEGLARAS
jgi:3-deoxy-D-manno-octulosonic-acid transferase